MLHLLPGHFDLIAEVPFDVGISVLDLDRFSEGTTLAQQIAELDTSNCRCWLIKKDPKCWCNSAGQGASLEEMNKRHFGLGPFSRLIVIGWRDL